MSKRIAYEKIFTPQGMLGEVSKKPNLDFLMNIFKIPRIYGVSGFGQWTVGQHTVACAFLALYWSAFNKYRQEKRDRLVTLALVHDAHEAVVGDILPFFKTQEVKEAIASIQKDILNAFAIVEDKELAGELKLIDMISFLYEISQSKPIGLDLSKQKLLQDIYKRQYQEIIAYANRVKIEKKRVEAFLKRMSLVEI
ncbi:HD domain-containing protein [Candidatus Microgenomates bacterium]|nr:HD domain-containing protein [Candidatus Microgenomates bacterium]